MAQAVTVDRALRVASGAIRAGVPEEQLLASSLIERRYGDDRDVISHSQYVLFCLNVGLLAEDGLLGLSLRGMHAGFVPLTVRTMDGCQTLEDAIGAVEKLYRLVSPSVQIALHTDADDAELLVSAEGRSDAEVAALEETQLGFLTTCCNHFLGRPLRLTGTTIRRHTSSKSYGSHLVNGAPVQLDERSSVRFPRYFLSARRAGATGSNAIWDCIRPWLRPDDRSRGVPVGNKTFRLDSMARAANASSSTMRRRFEQVEGGFRGARQRALVDAAVARLRESTACVESIALELGYADARSLRRFLKNSTGKTPQEIRDSVDEPGVSAVSEEAIYHRIEEVSALMERQ